MDELTLTRDLITALEAAGITPASAEPEDVVVIAMYLDLLAKEYGLSESLDIDTDPIERTQLHGPVMGAVRHYIASGADELDAEMLRARLYGVFVELAGEASARRTLNQNTPLTESGLLHLAQVYWNLEANDARPKLPIKPADGRDIPVFGVAQDFATMRWTARGKVKGQPYNTSGQAFRKQGARLVVLAAKKLMENVEPMPNTARASLAIQPTSNPEAPLEITLKGLVKQAQAEGQHEVAVQTATSYLSIIQQRAAARPFESEPDLAGAYMLRSWADLMRHVDRISQGTRAEFSGKYDIESAIRSLSTLVDLEPDNIEHRAALVEAFTTLSMWQTATNDSAGAVASARQAVATIDGIPVEHPERLGAEIVACIMLAASSEGADAIKAARRGELALAKIEAMDPSERPEGMGPDAIAAARAQLQSVLLGRAVAIDSQLEAVVAAERMVAAGEEAQSALLDPLVELATALGMAGRLSEAADPAARALALVTPDYVRTHPQFQLSVLVSIAWGSEDFDSDRVTDNHADLLEAASEAAPGNMSTLGFLLVAFMILATRCSDAGLDSQAHDWVLRAIAAARRIRPTEIPDHSKKMFVGALMYVFVHLSTSQLSVSGDDSAEPREAIARLLSEVDPGWGDHLPWT